MMPQLDTQSCHGVMVSINGQGILITGEPGIGKSSLALELITQGHQLVADDIIDISSHNKQLVGHCPAMLKGLLNSRELGTINIEQLFGINATIASAPLRYVVELNTRPQPSQLEGTQQSVMLMEHVLPKLIINPDSPASVISRLLIWLKMQQHHNDANLELRHRQLANMHA